MAVDIFDDSETFRTSQFWVPTRRNLRLKQTWRVKGGRESLPGAWSQHHIHHWAAGGPSRLCQVGCASSPVQPIGCPACENQYWVSIGYSVPIRSFCWSRPFTAKFGQLVLRNSYGLIYLHRQKDLPGLSVRYQHILRKLAQTIENIILFAKHSSKSKVHPVQPRPKRDGALKS
jgi:hypothetical protein